MNSRSPSPAHDLYGRLHEGPPATADPEGAELLVSLVDNAGWHVAERPAVPANMLLHPLPPCTPELQPLEPPWPTLRGVVADAGLESLEAMEPGPAGRRCWPIDHPEIVRAAVGFHRAVAPNG